MKKIVCFLMLIFTINLMCIPVLAESDIKVSVNGKNLVMDEPPVIVGGRTLVPLRTIFEAIGVTPIWDNATKTVTASTDKVSLRLTIGEGKALVNGKPVTLDVPGTLVNGRTMIPTRFIAETFDSVVGWDPATKTVQITSKSVVAAAPSVFHAENGTIELEKRSLFEGRVEISVPKKFTEMSDEMAEIKYPNSRRPTYVLTNENGSVNVAFNYTSNLVSDDQMGDYVQSLKLAFVNLYPSATWYSDGVEKVHGKNIGKLELLTPALDCKIYNLIICAELDGKLLLTTVNCTESQMKDWKPIANAIMRSVYIK